MCYPPVMCLSPCLLLCPCLCPSLLLPCVFPPVSRYAFVPPIDVLMCFPSPINSGFLLYASCIAIMAYGWVIGTTIGNMKSTGQGGGAFMATTVRGSTTQGRCLLVIIGPTTIRFNPSLRAIDGFMGSFAPIDVLRFTAICASSCLFLPICFSS